MGKQLLNDPADVVKEMIEGFCLINPRCTFLDGFGEAVKVIIRKDWDKSKVAVISGGGSGHEPAHAGYIGEGLLTAAVLGDVFASPSVAAVLSAIVAASGPKGCVLIVKNYTGDRLNFGLAAERAKAAGIPVEMVIVGDDCALEPGSSIAGRRGLAGTVLVHKVAGAAAEAGLSASDVAAEARAAAERTGTMGVALSTCALPGGVAPARLGPSEIEMGLGIHGEPGAAVAEITAVDDIVEKLTARITSQMGFTERQQVALLVNNLGCTTAMELAVATRSAVLALQRRGITAARVYAGPFVTAIDMAGISVTVAALDSSMAARLDAPTDAPAWPKSAGAASASGLPKPVPLPALPGAADAPEAAGGAVLSDSEAAVIRGCIAAAAESLLAAEADLTEWDTRVGDGDCGRTLSLGARQILTDLPSYPLASPAATAAALANSVRHSMGGTSGVLYDIFLTKAGAAAAQVPASAARVEVLRRALKEGADAIAFYGGAGRGFRTMLDALIPASEALEASTAATASEALAAAAAAAREGADATRDMAARAGRSSYVPAEVLKETPDPGAMAAATWLAAAAATAAAAALAPNRFAAAMRRADEQSKHRSLPKQD